MAEFIVMIEHTDMFLYTEMTYINKSHKIIKNKHEQELFVFKMISVLCVT